MCVTPSAVIPNPKPYCHSFEFTQCLSHSIAMVLWKSTNRHVGTIVAIIYEHLKFWEACMQQFPGQGWCPGKFQPYGQISPCQIYSSPVNLDRVWACEMETDCIPKIWFFASIMIPNLAVWIEKSSSQTRVAIIYNEIMYARLSDA